MYRRALLTALALVILLSSTGCQREEPAFLSIPLGNPVTIDGTMAPGEWDEARVETFADGSELLLMYSGGDLYLGIRASTPEMSVGNVFLDRGDEIAILHTSAALGTAIYEKGPDAWQQAQAFNWRCRRTDDSDAAQAERDVFFLDEQWVSVNSRVGAPNELEYQIAAPSGPLRLAVNHIKASEPNVKTPWPIDLDDDCIRPTPGRLPAQMQFSPDRWATIDLP